MASQDKRPGKTAAASPSPTAAPARLTAREGAYLVLRQVEQEGAYANLELRKFLAAHQLPALEARLMAELVYGVSRMGLALDHILAQLLTKPLEQLMPEARVILRMALYQLYFLDRVEPYAAVDQAVRLAKKYTNPALARLVNGVLRSYLRRGGQKWLPDEKDPAGYLHLTLSYPQWLAEYLLKRLGPEQALAFGRAGNEHHGVYLRTNSLRLSREELLDKLEQAAMPGEAAGWAPETVRLIGPANVGGSGLLSQGLCTVQGPASQLAAHALSPRPGSRVLDLCAAPGGKTTHMAELMGDRGEVRAFDLHPHKLQLIEDNCRRLGLNSVRAETADSSQLADTYDGWADYVLLDAPCSGLGVLSERPDSRWHKQPEDIPRLAKAASRLLAAAGRCLKPGGLLCYSTCTVTEEENSANIRRFLAAHPEFSREPMEKLAAMFTDAPRREAALAGEIQLWPHQGGEGFYIALLRKQP